MASSSQSNMHTQLAPIKVLFHLLLMIGALLDAQVAGKSEPTPKNNKPPVISPAANNVTSSSPIEAGLVFMPNYLKVDSAAVKNFGGYHYDCVTDSCHIGNSTTSPKAVGALTFKSCFQYSSTMGTSPLLPTKVDVLAVHQRSYHYIEKLKTPIGKTTEWPPRVDVVGYNTTTKDHTVSGSRYFHCPLSVPDNLVRPWCFSCTHTTNTTF
ncbi:hypothetical protein DFH28DRAFT_1220491 [Melampsora americana]|nr:hypothetical protein DFH28DRAFT_1220491 [Melampsora americana]